MELCSSLTSFEYVNVFLRAIEKSFGSYYIIYNTLPKIDFSIETNGISLLEA